MTRHTAPRKITALWQSGALLLAGAIAIAPPATAQVVGTTTAVNPTTDSTPLGGSTQTLTIGARVLHKERIHTSPSGSAQLLFLDKSTLSIAPNTSLVIDEFVYDPNSGKGHMLATLTVGALRYVGGELSHQGQTTIKTDRANIGIRGGMATIVGYATVINDYGTTTITTPGGNGPIVINIPGYEWNFASRQIVQVTAAEITHLNRIFTSTSGHDGGGPHFSGGNFECGTPSTPACPASPWTSTNTGANDADQLIVQGTRLGTSQTGGVHTGSGGGCGSSC